ncbi:phage holin family protein [Staphylococcus epidermidis]|uniref:phage holin family protein n=1 Tax=Staphylococcus epidermidis TaxID=1282 RepID=UPI00026C0908|nr:phage holin family protein [Staphylococcus epidermidis]EJD80580.1 toxin secretion/phage lysis holin [Staphylococcus epidermidis NIHLM095]EJD83219.1 toxin secretion/phage lysis holin [Staphylococcus epidermidis NIHLM087]MCT1660382.1 phage holin family protein [Staphylococcus epidermidis]MDH9341214.1 phage holin family protein [Staphylococcus epidermidis]MDH9360394.1 phage holin family protein [Staphylococcus epidermidis]
MDSVKNFDVEVDDFMSLIYSGNKVLVYILLLLIFVDVVTGMITAFSEGKLMSKKAMLGYVKKIAFLCVIIVSNTLDIIFQLHGLLVNATVMFFIIGEATSIVENSVKLGVPIPEQLKNRLNITEETNKN